MTTADRHALTLLAADALADTMPPEDLLDAVGELDDLTDDEFAALFEDRPATFGDLAARPAPVSLPVVFSEATADKQFSLPGPAGERAYNLMAHLRAEGTRTLYRLAERAVSRLVEDPAAVQSAYTLFDDDELAELKQSLAATVAAADMLGRARIAQLAAMKQKAKAFAEYTLTQSRTGGPKAVAPGKPPLYGDDAIAATKGGGQPKGEHEPIRGVEKVATIAPTDAESASYESPKPFESETGKPWTGTVMRGRRMGVANTDAGDYGKGLYWSGDGSRAAAYAKPAYGQKGTAGAVEVETVSLTNPIVFKSVEDGYKFRESVVGAAAVHNPQDQEAALKMHIALKKSGHDGVVVYDTAGNYTATPEKPFEVVKLGGVDPALWKKFPALEKEYVAASLAPKAFSEQPYATFAEGDEFAAFAEPVPPRPPLEALDYFRKLVPSLDNDPLRYGPLLDRHAFTLAYATDQTMLESVKRALLANLAGQTESANLIAGLEGERNVRGAELVQSILDRAGVSPRNDSYASLVYRTNTLDAYHQGMQRELAKPEVQEIFPAWRYLGIKDGREGDDHRPNFGRVYPVTMPFTEARGPRPYHCRCSCQPMDRDELKLFIGAGGVVETTPQYGRG